jgi:hypothetical protein
LHGLRGQRDERHDFSTKNQGAGKGTIFRRKIVVVFGRALRRGYLCDIERGGVMLRALPVTVVLGIIAVIWYVGAVWLNAQWVYDQAERAGTVVTFAEVVPQTMAQDRPLLPPPHQVAAELWDGVAWGSRLAWGWRWRLCTAARWKNR